MGLTKAETARLRVLLAKLEERRCPKLSKQDYDLLHVILHCQVYHGGGKCGCGG
jgi:hypothetical protein